MSFSKTKLYAVDQRIKGEKGKKNNSILQQLHCDCEKN